MCHLLQMKAERLLTQAQAQISTLKLAGHLVAAAVCSNALQDVETDGTAENTGVVFAVRLEASLLPSSNIFAGFIVDKMGFPFCPSSRHFCSQLFWKFSPLTVGHSYYFFSGFDFFLLRAFFFYLYSRIFYLSLRHSLYMVAISTKVWFLWGVLVSAGIEFWHSWERPVYVY